MDCPPARHIARDYFAAWADAGDSSLMPVAVSAFACPGSRWPCRPRSASLWRGRRRSLTRRFRRQNVFVGRPLGRQRKRIRNQVHLDRAAGIPASPVTVMKEAPKKAPQHDHGRQPAMKQQRSRRRSKNWLRCQFLLQSLVALQQTAHLPLKKQPGRPAPALGRRGSAHRPRSIKWNCEALFRTGFFPFQWLRHDRDVGNPG